MLCYTSPGMLPMFLVRVAKGEKGEEVAAAFSDDETTLSAALLSEPCKPKLALFPQGSELKADDGPEVFLPGDDHVPTKKELQVPLPLLLQLLQQHPSLAPRFPSLADENENPHP